MESVISVIRKQLAQKHFGLCELGHTRSVTTADQQAQLEVLIDNPQVHLQPFLVQNFALLLQNEILF